MSILDPAAVPPSDPAAPAPATDPATPPMFTDAQLAAMMDGLRGALTDMMKTAIDTAQATMPMLVVNSGTVLKVTVNNGTANAGTATCKMDGDDTTGTIIASIICDRPNPGDRVMVMTTPAATSYVIGIPGGTGLAAGFLVAYIANITTDTIGSNGIPRGVVRAYGQVLEQAAAPWLYAATGTLHNTGGETTTQFRVIDMRGRLPIGLDNMGGADSGTISLANAIGTGGGAETHTISQGNLPSVNFTVSGGTPEGTVSISSVTGSISVSDSGHTHNDGWGTTYVLSAGDGTYPAAGSDSATVTGTGYASVTGSFSFSSGTASFSGTGLSGAIAASGGSGTPINHLPPVKVVNWCVTL